MTRVEAQLVRPHASQSTLSGEAAISGHETPAADAEVMPDAGTTPLETPLDDRRDVPPDTQAREGDDAAAAAAARRAGSIIPDELLTRRPQPIRVAELDTPHLRNIPAAGRIILDLTVRRTGRVSNVLVVYCDLPGPYLAHAMKSFLEATYAPGELLGEAVDATLRVEISVRDGVPTIVEGAQTGAPAAKAP